MDGEREGRKEEKVGEYEKEIHGEYRPEIVITMFEHVVGDEVECPYENSMGVNAYLVSGESVGKHAVEILEGLVSLDG